MKLRSEGDSSAAKLLSEATATTPTRSQRILDRWKSKSNDPIPLTAEEALSMILFDNLTKQSYIHIRNMTMNHKTTIFPPYYKVLEAKKNFYPDSFIVSDSHSEIKLQDLMNRTCASIVNIVCSSEVMDIPGFSNLKLIGKWGFDGSSGYNSYKQKFAGSDEELLYHTDNSIFVTSFVPLRLLNGDHNNTILWKNPKPSSSRFCRPIKIQFRQESTDLTIQEEMYIQRQIDDLIPYPSSIGPISFELHETMVDGKVCNSLSHDAGSMKCFICGVTISKMNHIEYCRALPTKEEAYRFGLSTLHSYIRFFEWFLHISYKIDLKKWRVSNATEKDIIKHKKERIQKEFKEQLGLVVDVPKQGAGNTNDGNTARRFFENSDISSKILGLDQNLIDRCGAILSVINSNYSINVSEFEHFCLETAERYVEMYGWYYMPVSVHKILIHGSEVIKNFITPIGEMSEEAQEANNKNIRYYKEHHTRKVSRKKSNEDLLKRLYLTSDPQLIYYNDVKPHKHKPLTPMMARLVDNYTYDEFSDSDEEISLDTSIEQALEL